MVVTLPRGNPVRVGDWGGSLGSGVQPMLYFGLFDPERLHFI